MARRFIWIMFYCWTEKEVTKMDSPVLKLYITILNLGWLSDLPRNLERKLLYRLTQQTDQFSQCNRTGLSALTLTGKVALGQPVYALSPISDVSSLLTSINIHCPYYRTEFSELISILRVVWCWNHPLLHQTLTNLFSVPLSLVI